MTRLVVAGFVIVSGLVAALEGLRGPSAVEEALTENLAHRARRQVLEAQIFALGDRLLEELEQSRQLAPEAVSSLPGWEDHCLDLPASHAGADELLAWLAAQVARLEELESQRTAPAQEPAIDHRQQVQPPPQESRAVPRR